MSAKRRQPELTSLVTQARACLIAPWRPCRGSALLWDDSRADLKELRARMAAAAVSAAVDALFGLSWSSRWLGRRKRLALGTGKLPSRRCSAAAAAATNPLAH